MQIQIESTDVITDVGGVPVRLWEGVTADGVRCKVFVHRIAVANDEDASQFDRELQEKLPPPRHFPLVVHPLIWRCKAKSEIEAVCDKLVDELQGIIADVRRLATTRHKPDEIFGLYEQRFSLVRSALYQAGETLDAICPYRRRRESTAEPVAKIVAKEPLAIEWKP